MTLRVGLTGGIASGKSTVSALLANAGFSVIDYDLIAREVVQRGSVGLQQISEQFGTEFIDGEGNLDRARMGEHVFGNQEALRALEAITHPLILSTVQERDAAARGIVVHDNPLLVEMGGHQACDVVVVVDAPEGQQIARMVANRGMSETEARQRMANQLSSADRLAAADIVIDNSGDLAALERRVAEVVTELRQRATQ